MEGLSQLLRKNCTWFSLELVIAQDGTSSNQYMHLNGNNRRFYKKLITYPVWYVIERRIFCDINNSFSQMGWHLPSSLVLCYKLNEHKWISNCRSRCIKDKRKITFSIFLLECYHANNIIHDSGWFTTIVQNSFFL